MEVAHAARDLANGWEVAHPTAGSRIEGAEVIGFRDRAAAGLDMRVIPAPAVTVVIEFGSGLTVDGAAGRQAMGSLIGGLWPGAVRIRGERVKCVEVRLSPVAAYSLLGCSLSDLDGTVVDLADLCGPSDARRLREQLAEAAGWPKMFALTDAFLDRMRGSASADPEVAASWDRIVASRGGVRVGELAASCGWSRKRLWARFTAQIGLTPKRAAMLVRFDRAVAGLSAGADAAAVAVACGYTDQSHLHRDVATFTGRTPSALVG